MKLDLAMDRLWVYNSENGFSINTCTRSENEGAKFKIGTLFIAETCLQQ